MYHFQLGFLVSHSVNSVWATLPRHISRENTDTENIYTRLELSAINIEKSHVQSVYMILFVHHIKWGSHQSLEMYKICLSYSRFYFYLIWQHCLNPYLHFLPIAWYYLWEKRQSLVRVESYKGEIFLYSFRDLFICFTLRVLATWKHMYYSKAHAWGLIRHTLHP